MGFSISTINDYVLANEKQLIGKAVVGSKTAQHLTLQTGVKDASYLNILTATSGLQAGGCGWNASGTTTLTRRKIQTGQVKVNLAFCDKDLIKNYAQNEVQIAVNPGKTLPFAQEFTNQHLSDIRRQNENIYWQGDTSLTGSTYLNLADGFIKIIGTASGVVDATIGGKTLAANTLEAIDAIVAGIPNEVIDRDDLVVFVGYDIFRKAIKAWVDANKYHYVPAELDGQFETVIPGTNIKLVGVNGLTGQNKAYASYEGNLFLGTDMEGDAEKFLFWYSEDNSEYRLKVEYNIGVQVAFPEFVVKYTA